MPLLSLLSLKFVTFLSNSLFILVCLRTYIKNILVESTYGPSMAGSVGKRISPW